MRPKGTRKAAVAAVVALIALVGSLSATIAIPAMAQDPPMVWVGPGCPGGLWDCRDPGPIHQPAGQDNQIHCTAADCSGFVQENTTFNNSITCDQQSETPGVTLRCGGDGLALNKQTNVSGTNTYRFSQRFTLFREVFVGVTDNTLQNGSSIVQADIQNGTGRNEIGSAEDPSEQEVDATAISQINGSVTHTQQFEQLVNINAFSNGDEYANVEQLFKLRSTARGLTTEQRQNTAGHPQNPGQGDQELRLKVYSTLGEVTALARQNQDIEATATLPTIDFARNAVQQIGNGNPVTNATGDPQGNAFVDTDSDNNAVVDVKQFKKLVQKAVPHPLFSSVITEDILDQFNLGDLLGNTAHFFTGESRAEHHNTGDRVCEMHGNLHSKVLASLDQGCNLNNNNVEQHAEGEQAAGDLVCDNSGCTTETTSSTPVEVLGNEGMGDGYWKTHTGEWPEDAQPGDPFVSHFSQGALHPALANATLLGAISSQGGGNTLEGAATNLARQAVGGLLNAHHDGVDYPLHSTDVVKLTNTALAGTRADMLAQAAQFEAYNQAGCTDTDCPPG